MTIESAADPQGIVLYFLVLVIVVEICPSTLRIGMVPGLRSCEETGPDCIP